MAEVMTVMVECRGRNTNTFFSFFMAGVAGIRLDRVEEGEEEEEWGGRDTVKLLDSEAVWWGWWDREGCLRWWYCDEGVGGGKECKGSWGWNNLVWRMYDVIMRIRIIQ